MKKFDQLFTEAVKLLLIEKEGDKPKPSPTPPVIDDKRPSATAAIVWNPGSGRWSDVIKGLKQDANVGYEEAISKSAAVGARSTPLMAKLAIVKKSTQADPLLAAAEILKQAVSSPLMSTLYGDPRVSKELIEIPIKLSMKSEDVNSGEGVSGRNATVFIHLTLIGAYNSKMFTPAAKLKIQTATEETGAVIIRKG